MVRTMRWLLGACVLGLLTHAGTAFAQNALEGTFVLVNGEAQRVQAFSAVDTGTRSLATADREPMQLKIEDMIRPEPRLIVRRDGTSIIVVSGTNLEQRSSNDFTAATTDGGWTLRQRIVNGVLERRLERDGWVQIYRHSLSADRRSMYVDIEISGPSMSTPVTTRIAYARQ